MDSQRRNYRWLQGNAIPMSSGGDLVSTIVSQAREKFEENNYLINMEKARSTTKKWVETNSPGHLAEIQAADAMMFPRASRLGVN